MSIVVTSYAGRLVDAACGVVPPSVEAGSSLRPLIKGFSALAGPRKLLAVLNISLNLLGFIGVHWFSAIAHLLQSV